MQRDVEMDAPLFLGIELGGTGAGERLVQIGVASEGAVAITGDHLVKINRIDKGLQGGAVGSGGNDFERGAEMKFADANAAGRQAAQSGFGGFVFDGKVAAVVIHAKVLAESFVFRAVGLELLEKIEGFRSRFEKAERFGLEAEVERLTGTGGDLLDMIDSAPELLAHLADLIGILDERLERTGDRADASLNAGRC